MLHELNSRLSLLDLKCRRPVEHLLAGEYQSVFKGRGIEFEDVRVYQRGDDVRAMDWKVTARTGEPHIKRYIEEREQFVYLLVDVSASLLDDSDGRKRATMAELCSLITLAAIKNNDRVGLILFSDHLELVVPPGKGRQHALRIMDALVSYEPEGRKTSFQDALGRFGHMAQKRSIAFVVSDFLAGDYLDELSALALRHDINAVNLMSVPKSKQPRDGLMSIHDTETKEMQLVDLRQSWEESDAHHRNLQVSLIDCGVNLMELVVGEDCVEALTGFFRTRQRRVADETGG